MSGGVNPDQTHTNNLDYAGLCRVGTNIIFMII